MIGRLTHCPKWRQWLWAGTIIASLITLQVTLLFTLAAIPSSLHNMLYLSSPKKAPPKTLQAQRGVIELQASLSERP